MKKMPANLLTVVYDSPLGALQLGAVGDELYLASWSPSEEYAVGTLPVLDEARRQLDAYFSRERRVFDLPLHLDGTDFQLRAWRALCHIPYGTTRSYAEEARVAGCGRAFRAIGNANHHNPICIIIPCHRVITSAGTLGGYGGGLWRKKALLALERAGSAWLYDEEQAAGR